MVSHSDGIVMATSAEGGLFGGLKRMVAGENFFQNTYTAPAAGGEITLAGSLPGDARVLTIEGQDLLLKSGAYMSSESGVSIDASWGGAKGFFGGPGLILLRVSGRGNVLIGAYGAIEERILAPGPALRRRHRPHRDARYDHHVYACASPAGGNRRSWAARVWSVS
jgi:uncharacterized protein (TIGR00266 family)